MAVEARRIEKVFVTFRRQRWLFVKSHDAGLLSLCPHVAPRPSGAAEGGSTRGFKSNELSRSAGRHQNLAGAL